MLHSSDLTISQVSGIIAAGVVVVKLVLPNLFPVLVLGTLREKNGIAEETAVSWSVIGRELHSSLWPTLLRTDSSASDGVLPSFKFFKLIELLGSLLVAIAAIVTPLGLYNDVVAYHGQTLQPFHYIGDKGIFGQATIPRDKNATWSRNCGGLDRVWACPNSTTNVTLFSNASGEYYDVELIDTSVPQSIINLFSSGSSVLGNSVSSIFDIEWRSWTWDVEDTVSGFVYHNPNNATTFAVGSFRDISVLALDDKFEVIEGLVVDTVNGGVGFRNHSAPPFTSFGSTWTEDLLFIEPITHCVDTNLTIDFALPVNQSQRDTWTEVTNVRLVDHGGFSNINHTYPEWDRNDTQNKPEFWMRAYKAAWMNNVYTMAFLNVTNVRNLSDPKSPRPFHYLNSTIGKEFPLQYSDGTSALNGDLEITPQAMGVTQFGSFLMGLDEVQANVTIANLTIPARPPLYPNPFKIEPNDFLLASELCEGAGSQDFANITNFAATCGLVLSVPRKKDGVDDLMFLPGSEWTTSMYSCMSAVRAVVKTVTFLFNTTDDLSGLEALKIEEKIYPNEESKPLWGVENTQIPLADAKALWGLVSPEAADKTTNLSTLRKESLLLPGVAFLTNIFDRGYQNLPGVDFPDGALSDAYTLGSGKYLIADYSGRTNLAIFQRWRNLSRTPDSTAKIFNLIWTDLAANAVVGTKSLAPVQGGAVQKRATSGVALEAPVTVYHRTIKYHLPYSIPAILLLVFLLIMSLMTSCAFLLGRTGSTKMTRYLNATSAGRIMTSKAGLSTGGVDVDVPTKTWLEDSGKMRVVAGRGALRRDGA